MTKFKLLVCSIAQALLMLGCSQILEPVSFSSVTQDKTALNAQEDFKIRTKSLTFKNARLANSDPYARKLMLNGIGASANVFNESDFLNSEIPPSLQENDYYLGIGDKISFMQINEFATSKTQLPPQSIETEYLLGIGDELTLVQLSQGYTGLNSIFLSVPKIRSDDSDKSEYSPQQNEKIIQTSGIIGTNGNVLLLGLGNIKAKNRPLSEIQTEVRNILIRNGLAPNFQLEITGFNSKKAFITFSAKKDEIIQNTFPITNLPIKLKEVVMSYGLQPSARKTLVITLVRDGQKYRYSAQQVFDSSFKGIIIQNRDQIKIDQSTSDVKVTSAVVGSNGNILLSGVGSIKADKRSISMVQTDIARILSQQGMISSFQLEITEFNSKKFYLVSRNNKSQVIPLTNSGLTLKEAVFGSGNVSSDTSELTLVNLIRNGTSYQMTLQEITNGVGSKILIQDGDTVKLESYKYKPGKVFVLSGAGNAKMIPIEPSNRETLADILFTPKGAFNNLLAKRSEVYLLRGQNPSIAYHLDAQDVSRILVAAKTELRPNDIVYVADRPIISFSRTLAEILPLRILLRDIRNDNIP